MRKRQFKKVLSLVLALAMVFTMNTSVFAAPDPAEAPVEETAAETTAPAAETPAAEEQAPATEPAAPADQEAAAPAAETTPAPEAAPVEEKKEETAPATEENPASAVETTPEDPAGDGEAVTVEGWTITKTGGGDAIKNVDCVYSEGTLSVTTDVTIVEKNDATAGNDIDISITGTGIARVDLDDNGAAKATPTSDFFDYDSKTGHKANVALAAEADVSYVISDNVAADPADVLTYDDANASDTQGKLKLTEDYSEGWTVYRAADGAPETVTTAGTPADKKAIANEYIAYNGESNTAVWVNPVAAKACQANGPKTDSNTYSAVRVDGSPKIIKVSTTGNAKEAEVAVVTPDAANLARSEGADGTVVKDTDFTITTQQNKKYSVFVRYPADADNYSSNWEKVGDVEPDATGIVVVEKDINKLEGGKTYVVSGLSIDTSDDIKGSITSANSIPYFTINVEGGTIRNIGESFQEAVSINLGEKGVMEYDDSNIVGDKISIKGTGKVFFDGLAGAKAVIQSVETGVTLSVNTTYADTGIVVSNNAAYQTVIANVDTEGVKVAKEGETIIFKANIGQVFATLTDTDYQNNTIALKTADGYVLSSNGPSARGTAAFKLTEATANDAINYGKTVFWTSNYNTSSFIFQKVPERNENILTGVACYPEDVGTSAAYFHVTGKTSKFNKDTSITTSASPILFALSTNTGAYTEDMSKFTEVGQIKSLDDGEKVYQLSVEAGGQLVSPAAKDAKKFYITAVNATDGGFWSKPIPVGEFELNGKKSFTLAAPSATVYAGQGQGVDKDGNATNVVNSNKLVATLESATIDSSDGWVKKDDYKIGKVQYYLLPANLTSSIADFYDYGPDDLVPSGAILVTSGIELVSGNYYAKAIFRNNAYGTERAMYDSASSNTLSFNVVPAPVSVSVKDSKISVPEKKKIHIGTGAETKTDFFHPEPKVKITNTITNKTLTYGTYFEPVNTTIKFVKGTDLLNDGAVSYNKGVYEYTVSNGSIQPKAREPYAAKYVIDWTKNEAGPLDVYGSATIKITGVTVPYGTAKSTISTSLNATLNSTGADQKVSDGVEYNFYDVKYLSGNTVSAGAVKLTDPEILNMEAGKEMLAQVVYTGSLKTDEGAIKSDVVRVPVEKRLLDLIGNDEKLKSKRNVALPETLTVSADKVKGTAVDGAYPYAGDTTKLTAPLSADAALNKDDINIKVADTYHTRMAADTIKLKTDLDKNFKVNSAYADYIVLPAYYAYWILEYGGYKAKTGQKFVSFNEIAGDDIAASEGVTGIVFKTPKEIGPSWNDIPNKNGVKATDLFNGTKDYISGWKARTENGGTFDYYDNSKPAANRWVSSSSEIPFNTMKNNTKGATALEFGHQDVYFYAVVAAKATDNVTIKSLVPVVYDGRKHVNSNDKKAEKGNTQTINYDIQLDITDTEKLNEEGNPTVLEIGKDYTVSVKNNTNASVKYGKDGKADDIEQLFKENKRPQVVITGKGDYKGLKATVYFDILPRDISEYTTHYTYADFYKINKNGKGIKYSNKPYWTRTVNNKKKTYKLGKKDYTEKLQKIATENGNTFYTDSNPKTVNEKGDYRFVMTGTGNYCGTIRKTVKIYAKDDVLLSDFVFKGKNAKYTGATISADTGFKLKATKKAGKIKAKDIKYGTDFVATTAAAWTEDNTDDIINAQMKDGMAVAAGSYTLTIHATPALIAKGVIPNVATATVKVSPKKLSAKKFTTNWNKKGEAYDGKSKDVTVTSTTYTADKDYYAIPTTFVASDRPYVSVWDPEAGTEGDWVARKAEPGETVGFNDGFITNDCTGSDDLKEALKLYNNYSRYNVGGQNIYDSYIAGTNPSYSFHWEYTGKPTGKTYSFKLVPNNADSRTYALEVKGKGQFSGSEAEIKYVRKPGAIKDAVVSIDTIAANINGTYPVVSIKVKNSEGKEEFVPLNTFGSDKADLTGVGDNIYAYSLKWSGNKKATDKASVTIKGSSYGQFTGSKKVTFKIKQAPITSVSAVSIANGKTADELASGFYASVEDTIATKKGYKTPNVVLYQYSQDGKKRAALKQKTDYKFTYNTAKTSENSISINAADKPEKSSFEIKKPVMVVGATFSVYETKGKKYDVSLSSDFLSVSGDGTVIKAPYDSSKKKVTYTGNPIVPQIASVTVDGSTFVPEGTATTSDAFKNAAGTYECVVTSNAEGKVGTVKYEIQLKYTKGKTYTLGGKKVFSFKIVPQTSNGLVLEK